jgi:hypothetical protein
MSNSLDDDRARVQMQMFPLIDDLSNELKQETVIILRDFVENYEFEVALEWLYSVVSEQGITLSNEQEVRIKHLANAMQVDLNKI